ncbi:MAG: TIGR03862 family flavoprotein [Gammaproteobacteria bacterium]
MTSDAPESPPLPLQAVDVAIIGAGPAGLMAAQTLAAHGLRVDVYDGMASAGRKFLLAGRGGLNLTHAEPHETFVQRYGHRAGWLSPWLDAMGGQAVRDWADSLGIETFVGTSKRVFPVGMKAAPLLRAWLHRLRHPGQGQGQVHFHMRHRWCGWAGDGAPGSGHLMMAAPTGSFRLQARAVILALGGGSWARLGSDGAWVPWLESAGVAVARLQPANCGFDLAGTHASLGQPGWSEHFRERFAGQPFKSVVLRAQDSLGQGFERKGEFVATASGIEGSLVYAASALLRDEIARSGTVTVTLDLLPDRSADEVLRQVIHPRGSRSLSSHLKSRLGLDGIKMALLHECLDRLAMNDPASLARAIKSLPLTLAGPRPLDEAISTAGGVAPQALDAHLMLRDLPGVFCAGEMLDWEAPTGGYLLTACLASGRQAGEGAWRWLGSGN